MDRLSIPEGGRSIAAVRSSDARAGSLGTASRGRRAAADRIGPVAPHVALHVVMGGVMAATMLGPHSGVRTLVGAAGLLVLAMILSPFARHGVAVRSHVVDCFAMGLALVASMSGHLDAPTPAHAHATAAPLAAAAALALVAAGWGAARLALLLTTRTGRPASLVGAGLTATGLALMAAMA